MNLFGEKNAGDNLWSIKTCTVTIFISQLRMQFRNEKLDRTP